MNIETSTRPVIEPMLSLINVVFLLLIFFLVVGHITTEQQTELQILTTQQHYVAVTEPNENWLYVTQSGDCFYHQKLLSLEQFQRVFTAKQSLYIAVDTSLVMGDLQQVISTLRQLDITDISLITRLEESHSK
ncbi:biopolymer transporter ExbD [Shewanella gelidimarina]|uniref:ExbD/TolR family protein n=1 Tax=Shewanella gelidimarina TaxID=56813 RepID=UPI00200DBF75|nr:biopolymer transporter ExbD [Shewanella gelidimarina]MCL1058077.1 biopolymer transporter ExbD [Shewanella gelidimarina]